MGKVPDYIYLISDEAMKQKSDFKVIKYALGNLEEMKKAIKKKLFPKAQKEINIFVKTMKKAGYDYSKTGEELKKDIWEEKFKRDYFKALKNAKIGYEYGLKNCIYALKKDAKELNWNISEKIQKLEKICLNKTIEMVWEEIGTSLFQEGIDFSEISYIEHAFPLLKKNVKKLEPEKREFFEKQFKWAENTFHEKAMIACYKRSIGKKNSVYYRRAKDHAKEIGIII